MVSPSGSNANKLKSRWQFEGTLKDKYYCTLSSATNQFHPSSCLSYDSLNLLSFIVFSQFDSSSLLYGLSVIRLSYIEVQGKWQVSDIVSHGTQVTHRSFYKFCHNVSLVALEVYSRVRVRDGLGIGFYLLIHAKFLQRRNAPCVSINDERVIPGVSVSDT